jgi:hypothetical protein
MMLRSLPNRLRRLKGAVEMSVRRRHTEDEPRAMIELEVTGTVWQQWRVLEHFLISIK